MKKLFIACTLLAFSTLSHSFAFECKSKSTGIIYKVNSNKKVINVYEANGKKIVSEPYTQIDITVYESLPPVTNYSFSTTFGVLMEIDVREDSITGSFDDDEDLVCKKK